MSNFFLIFNLLVPWWNHTLAPRRGLSSSSPHNDITRWNGSPVGAAAALSVGRFEGPRSRQEMQHLDYGVSFAFAEQTTEVLERSTYPAATFGWCRRSAAEPNSRSGRNALKITRVRHREGREKSRQTPLLIYNIVSERFLKRFLKFSCFVPTLSHMPLQRIDPLRIYLAPLPIPFFT